MMKLTPQEIWNEYQSLTTYLTENDVYNVVKKNEKFYDGRQWDGAKADNIAKPTMNRLQRIGKYQIASLSSNDVGGDRTIIRRRRGCLEHAYHRR